MMLSLLKTSPELIHLCFKFFAFVRENKELVEGFQILVYWAGLRVSMRTLPLTKPALWLGSPILVCPAHFDLEMCFALQRRAGLHC